MRNYVQDGATITVTAPYDLASGAGCQVGNLFGVAANGYSSGDSAEIMTEGVFDLVKVTGAIAAGDLIYWDDSNKKVTKAYASGLLLVGAAVAAAQSGDATARVKLSEGIPQAVASKVLVGSASLDFPSTNGAATSDLTITVTGAAVGDRVALGLPAAPAASFVFFAFVSAADTVKVRAMNISGGALDPAAATYTVTVFQH
jgi:predicted RecA/RadA family phage recombinase